MIPVEHKMEPKASRTLLKEQTIQGLRYYPVTPDRLQDLARFCDTASSVTVPVCVGG